MSMEYISDIGYQTFSHLRYCTLPEAKSDIKNVDQCSNINNPFTPDKGGVVDKASDK